MQKLIISFVILLIGLSGCSGQKTDDNLSKNNSNKPLTDIKVNKEYDKDGNLIRFDSTYSYYYSNVENDTILKDSIFNNFKNYFNEMYNFSNDPFFNNSFFQDSLLEYDFYRNDFFINRFKKNQMQMNKLFFDMDSIKNEFFNRQFKE